MNDIDFQRKKLIHAGEMNIIHWIIVILSIILTFSAWHYSKYQFNQKLEYRFIRNAERVVRLVEERMTSYENAMWSGVAFIDAADTDIDYNQWLVYSKSLHIEVTYPGINGIGVIYNIQPSELDDYLKNQRAIRPDYAIHPNHNKPDYWPITYVEPAALNRKAIGLDMAFEANRYSSILKTRDTGLAQLTGPITLVQDAKKTPGFLFYAPFYENGSKPKSIAARRESFVGAIYAPFIMKNLMQGTLAEQNRHVSIKIHDAGELLFDDDDDDDGVMDIDADPLFTKKHDVELYGRTWSFSIQSNLSFRKESEANQSTFILIGGLTIDVMLFGLFLFLSRANRQALAYADKMTESLKEKTIHLEKSNSDLEQFSYIASHDLKSPLNAIRNLASWIAEDCQDIIPDESKEHLALLMQRSQRMMNLLNDLLDYSRVNRNVYTSEPVNLKEMCLNIIELQGSPSNFTFSLPDIEINIPKSPFEIVLRNLISNAIKHHDKNNGNVIISYENSENYHIISVKDDGPGIPPQFHDKAMEMFQTLQSRDKTEGSGMGLAMIKRTIEHYKGYISINSDGKHGTTMNIHWNKKQI